MSTHIFDMDFRPREPSYQQKSRYIRRRLVDIKSVQSERVECVHSKFKVIQFDSIFQALQDLHTFAPLQSQFLSKISV